MNTDYTEHAIGTDDITTLLFDVIDDFENTISHLQETKVSLENITKQLAQSNSITEELTIKILQNISSDLLVPQTDYSKTEVEGGKIECNGMPEEYDLDFIYNQNTEYDF